MSRLMRVALLLIAVWTFVSALWADDEWGRLAVAWVILVYVRLHDLARM